MRLVLTLAAAAALFGIAGVVDHTWKVHRLEHAEVSLWYCRHQGTRCGGPSVDAIERHWNQRELGYEAMVVALGGAAVVLAAARRVRG